MNSIKNTVTEKEIMEEIVRDSSGKEVIDGIIKDDIRPSLKAIAKNFCSNIYTSIKIFGKEFTKIIKHFTGIDKVIYGEHGEVIEGFEPQADNQYNSLKDSFLNIVNSIKNIFASLRSDFKEYFTKMKISASLKVNDISINCEDKSLNIGIDNDESILE